MKSYNSKRLETARLNPYNSVQKVCLQSEQNEMLYLGVKDVQQIPVSFVQSLLDTKRYVLHTLDAHAWGGRAIDINIKHPITGRFMTGSSSGTAVNVFCGINDIGIGTDGGGSVLAPALALNLFGFISPLLAEQDMLKWERHSTDGISFTPSLGFITRSYKVLHDVIKSTRILSHVEESQANVIVSQEDQYVYPFDTTSILYPDIYKEREALLPEIRTLLKTCDFMISIEGPIDLYGIGDTIFAHHDTSCEQVRKEAKKGLIRICNMIDATAICIPTANLAKGFVFICESVPEKIAKMLAYAEKIPFERSIIIKNYFENLSMYQTSGFDLKGVKQ